MSNPPITDQDRDLWRRAGRDEGQFAALLQETMAAVGATPAPAAAPEPPPAQSRRPFGRVELAAGVAGLAVALVLIALITRLMPAQEAPRPTFAPTATTTRTSGAPIAMPALPTAVPTSAPVKGLPHAIVAYSAPSGAVLGPIEAGRAFTPTARYGDAWVQLDVADSGKVWTEAGPLGLDLTGLRDLTPPTPAPPPPAAPAWEPPAAPESTEAPAHELQTERRPPPTKAPTSTTIVPKPPTNRRKPLDAPTTQDSSQPDALNRLEAAGWPVAMIRQAVTP